MATFKRNCLLCGELVAVSHPPYLLRQITNVIVGPFHPWCAKEFCQRHLAEQDAILQAAHDRGQLVRAPADHDIRDVRHE